MTGGEQVSFIKPSVAQIVSQSVHVPRVDKVKLIVNINNNIAVMSNILEDNFQMNKKSSGRSLPFS